MDKIEKMSGRTAVVRLDNETATLSTEFGLPAQKAELKKKIDLLEELRKITLGIDGLIVPRVLDRNETRGEYIVDRARGWNLTEGQGFKQGKLRGFFDIPLDLKLRGLNTYLNMIGRINSAGYAFRDHKSDSVFIDQDGRITVVDADGMVKQSNPWVTDQHVRNGIHDVTKGFFHRGMDKLSLGEDPELLIPAGANTIISNLDRADSATTASQRIVRWMNNSYDPSRNYPYNPNIHRDDIWKPGMTNFQYDIAEANFYLKGALGSEGFKYYSQFLERSGEK